jgi:citrate synthase
MPPGKGGLEDVVAAASAISDIIGDRGKLAYRGIDIHELASHSSFEETVYLLWFAALPTAAQLDRFTAQLASARRLSEPVRSFMERLPTGARPMEVLRTTVSALAFDDGEGEGSRDDSLVAAVRVTASTATIVAAWEQIRNHRPPVASQPASSHAADFLFMLLGREPDPIFVRAMDLDLILHADHELNASTFAARVTAATLADGYAATVAGVAALSGPLHGGATAQVMAMFQAIGDPTEAEAYVRDRRRAREAIPGFGHRVYRTEDPRTGPLREMSGRLAQHTGNRRWFDLARQVETVMLAQTGLHPNVDFYSTACYATMEIPVDLFATVFAVSRVAGWAAHVLEQYADNRLIRPRAEYVGPTGVPYVPLQARGAS